MMVVECLNCGETREGRQGAGLRVLGCDSCPRCGYVGWAPSHALDEPMRRLLRQRPLPRRRLLAIV